MTTQQRAGAYLLERFGRTDWVGALAARFLKSDPAEAHLDNLANPSVKALVVASVFAQTRKTVVVVCPDAHIARKYQAELDQLLPLSAIELFPAEEFTPYELSIFPVHALSEQIRILSRLRAGEPCVLLVSAKNLMLKHLSLEALEAHAISLAVGAEISPERLAETCLALGYLKTSLIMEPGEFSSRGDIFDVYPVNGFPVRIEFFGDTVESLRRVDIENQRSIEALTETVVFPRAGIVLTADNRERLENKLAECLARQRSAIESIDYEGLESTIQNQIQSLAQDFWPDGIDYYGPLIHDGPGDYKTLSDYIPQGAIAVLDDWSVLTNHLAGLSDRLMHQVEEGIAKGRLLDIGFAFHRADAEALACLKASVPRRLFVDSLPLESDGQLALEKSALAIYSPTVTAPGRFKSNLPEAMEAFRQLRREGMQVFVTTDNPQRVLDTCKEWDVPAVYWPENGLDAEQASWFSSEVLIARHGLQEGFILAGEGLAHFTDTELFGRKLKKLHANEKGGRRREDIDVINSLDDLRPGDFVVHTKHGIGQFVELRAMVIDRETREYLAIQYAGSDRLYLPVDQIHLLSRYRGAGDAKPKLNKMGGMEWTRIKSKVKKSIQKIARDLMKLYAARAKAKGHAFEPDTPWQVEMEEAFPYTETPDQWQAIQSMKADMESDKPMDRLICGDVGFGKTEVALRGLFKCVLSGKQAAFLAPTTILTQQHFNTLTERFQAYPVRVGLLSRFRTAKEQKEVVDRLEVGECDIVVGTHRLLGKDVKFKNLGLVVIDEEQRFGVNHKERLKQLRTEVDVLTLSATPIPRTLYMALSGIREMSLIKTPPTNRSPIKTFVGPYNPAQIRMAILQEMDRGGQVYFVHNRVKSIYGLVEALQDLVPEARFAVGHGQMAETDLETVMLEFAQRSYDVLVCTSIIESGLDIPNVNTIIVDRADHFGLAQLYQIRGRVGRSNVQAYAYCYYDPERTLTQDAQERLRCIREFTSLGSGYQVAMRDLEIRGVGNVLGEEQHGHMVAVGFDLYCSMLEESIEALKDGTVVEEKEDAIIDLNVTALIPDDWVGDKNVKLAEYKRLAGVKSMKAMEIIEAEWRDRFGEIPAPTRQLMRLVHLRILATEIGVSLVRADDEYIRISVPFGLQEWMKFQKALPDQMGTKARWVPGVAAKQGSMAVLLVRHRGMDGDDQIAFLVALFTSLAQQIADLKAALAAE